MRPPTCRPHRAVLGGWAAAALVVLLLAAQSLGLAHRAVHGPAVAAEHRLAEGRELAGEAGHAAAAFGHDGAQAEQCRLFDQLTLADSLLVATLGLPADAPRPAPVAAPRRGQARSADPLYLARGPPRAA
ncbi:MAG TPA: hypothetical protein VFR90_00320 [Methylibium sp.]|uniref:hypothetical protein n=1 Tax=Methylibium sp. TaxID=2067992 RepID=UPI002DB9F351|nr:hypothetical protein [Methylibium sp.]HEU4457549.1 hypothetical protein [Methylibium sp.]